MNLMGLRFLLATHMTKSYTNSSSTYGRLVYNALGVVGDSRRFIPLDNIPEDFIKSGSFKTGYSLFLKK